MPSLPVDNQALSSKEDAYRRYFGALKDASPKQPRCVLCNAMCRVCLIALIVSIPNYAILYIRFKQNEYFETHSFYYLYNFTCMIITWIWCLCVIYVIFNYKYSNLRIMTLNASIISLLSFGTSCLAAYKYHENGKHYNITYKDIWEKTNWRLDYMYFVIFRFPLTLYFSILLMYFSQYIYCCSCACTCLVTSSGGSIQQNKELREKLIVLPKDGTGKDEVEVFEYVSQTTGTIYGDDEDIDVSLSDDYSGYGAAKVRVRHDSDSTVSFQGLEKAARTVVLWYMALYCVVFCISLISWFAILTVNPKKYDDLRLVLYSLLVLIYFGFKWLLKRCARKIDTAIIMPNFSFEIITELLMSSFYWCNFRMFTLRYHFDSQDRKWAFPVIAFIHIMCEIFQDLIRMSAGYFNCTGRRKRDKKINKSNITQWKVRGAIDTSIRFIISMYSILFVSIRYLTDEYPRHIITEKDLWSSLILNYSVFSIEWIYFCCVLFRPGCAGKISDQQQINMAEPLMRMYNANKQLFCLVFCGTMVMASLLVI